MDQLTSRITGTTYRIGAALPQLGEGFYRGFAGATELVLRVAAEGAPSVAALEAEGLLLERLTHPQIAALRDRGRSGRVFFLVLDGPAERPLAELISESELAPTAALDILVQIAELLAELHAAGVVWGRLRPHAFWIDKAGRLKLVNLRGAAQSPAGAPLSLAEAVYLAPEQGASESPDPRADLYACGVLAYELLAGKPPFVGASPAELAVKHLTERAPDLGLIHPGLPAALVDLVERCLAKDPAARPATAALLLHELAAIREQLLAEEQARLVTCPRCGGRVPPVERCPLCNVLLEPPPPPPPPRRRSPLPFVAAGAAVLVLLCTLLGLARREAPAAVAPTSTPAAVVVAAPARPTPRPTATAAPLPDGTLAVAAGDVADANIDLILLRVETKDEQLAAELSVVGQIDGPTDRRMYQIFLDSATGGDPSAHWPGLAADYSLIYHSGDEAGQALRWDGAAWQGVGAAEATISGGRLTLRVPRDWAGAPDRLRYGAMTFNPGANQADYAPARGTAPAATR
ncbi:MAG TPA: serine/threonine-protein kinase [Roseiflexaceae bacterium]|nr:serine/threonine-protein kinase [Roseiflexaceae bacterium]